jgi:hypothetical protein
MGAFARTAIGDYRLSFDDQGKQTSLFQFVCSKQTEVCGFHFPFAEKNVSYRFPLIPFSVCGIPETWRYEDTETWRHESMETRRHGDMKAWRHGDTET